MGLGFLKNDTQNFIQTLVRGVLSLGGHAVVAYILIWTPPGEEVEVPPWLVGIFALVITWYFATRERGIEVMPRWQSLMRSFIRATHVVGGSALIVALFINDIIIPKWWIAIYVSILTFYFIELRDPPDAKA